MTWNFTRGFIYAGTLVAVALSMAGILDFDPVTGAVNVHEFNLYDVMARLGGLGSGLALIALKFGWGGKEDK